MARKRRDVGGATDKRIKELLTASRTLDDITETLAREGKTLGRTTVARRIRELRGVVKKKPVAVEVAVAEVPLPQSVEDIPEDTPLAVYDEWIKVATRFRDVAVANGNLEGIGKMGRLVTTLMESRRKAVPPEAPNPDDQPDMVHLGAQVALRLRQKIERIIEAAE